MLAPPARVPSGYGARLWLVRGGVTGGTHSARGASERLAACVQESCTLYKNLVQIFFRTLSARLPLPRGSVDDPNSPT